MKKKAIVATEIKKVPKVTRSFHGVREAAFDEMDMLRSGERMPDRANSIARQADVILKSAVVENEIRKSMASKGGRMNTLGLLT